MMKPKLRKSQTLSQAVSFFFNFVDVKKIEINEHKSKEEKKAHKRKK